MQFSAVGIRAGRGRAVLLLACILAGLTVGAAIALLLRPGTETHSQTQANQQSGAALQHTAAPQFALTDQDGSPVSLSSLRGRLVLLTFMDPQCSSLCPVMGRDIAAMEQRLPASVHPVLLIVSVAPGRTKSDVQSFVTTNLSTKWLSGWHWLIGPDAAVLQRAWTSWHVTVAATTGDVVHDEVLNVIDADGYLRVVYPAPLAIDDVVASIKKIAHA